ncbi:MAG: hypothetical protein GF388_12235, partial [Candidatus Aegiribacteria sp.]|nr:hypothetical protein [Candidatus Aegiribacteria sp.]
MVRMDKHKAQGVLFVVGSPRSGTKLLCGILNNHDQIMLASEFDSHARLLKEWGDNDPHANFESFFNDLSKSGYFIKCSHRGHKISKESYYKSIEHLTTAEALLVFLRYMIRSTRNKDINTSIIGQKSPHLIDRIEIMDRYYPNAKFIHIIRDVRNCALSSRNAWNTNIYRYAQRWYFKNSSYLKYADKNNEDRFITIRYEDLVNNSERQIRKLCDFLGVSFKNKLDRFNEPTEHYG